AALAHGAVGGVVGFLEEEDVGAVAGVVEEVGVQPLHAGGDDREVVPVAAAEAGVFEGAVARIVVAHGRVIGSVAVFEGFVSKRGVPAAGGHGVVDGLDGPSRAGLDGEFLGAVGGVVVGDGDLAGGRTVGVEGDLGDASDVAGGIESADL